MRVCKAFKPTNKVAAHFAVFPGERHADDCVADGVERIIEGGEERLTKS
jgi:hypothetical protein